MTKESRITCGIILLTVPAIIYGGYFLLGILSGHHNDLQLTYFQTTMFRAGHAHAGVLVILSLVAQILTDHANLNTFWKRISRSSFPFSAIFISAGFFLSASDSGAKQPNDLIIILYMGVILLIIGLVTLGIGLMNSKSHD